MFKIADENRTTRVVKGTPKHFFFSGTVYKKGTGKGNFAGRYGDGRMVGEVKVTALTNGRYSLRSIGLDGNGRLVHISGLATVVVDGRESTVADFYNRSRK